MLNQQETFKELLESAPDAMVIVDKQGKIAFVNAQTLKLFGYSREELIGKTVEILVPERFRNEHSSHRTRYTAEPRVRPMGAGLELYGRHKNGTEFPVEISLSPIETSKGTLFSSAIRDVTDRKKTEEQLKSYSAKLREINETLEEKVKERTAQLEKTHQELRTAREQFYQAQKMESLGTLAGGMAHEFGNLLVMIAMQADHAMSNIKNEIFVHEDLKEILNACNQANELVREVLLFSRRQTVQFASVNLNEIVTNLVKILLGVIGENFSLETHLEPQTPPIYAHAGHVQQILMNLILNAKDAMTDGGVIVVATRSVSVTDEESMKYADAHPGKFACLSVKDHGVGMDHGTISHIFDPFYSTKGPERGTGLGLSVVYGIVKRHQGWIHVDSMPGRGTTFHIYLPASLKP